MITQAELSASNNPQEASALAGKHDNNIETFALDVTDQIELGRAVASADVVVRYVSHVTAGSCFSTTHQLIIQLTACSYARFCR